MTKVDLVNVFLVIFLQVLSFNFATGQTAFGIGCDSPIPYSFQSNSENNIVFQQEVFADDAQFISLHFAYFNLPPGDYVTIRPKQDNASNAITISNSYINSTGPFNSQSIFSKAVVVELHASGVKGNSTDNSTCYGFKVEGITTKATILNPQEAICGADDSVDSKCFQANFWYPYTLSRSVARLLLHSSDGNAYFCSGWLVGSQGHLLTNAHCVDLARGVNQQIEIEFNAEGRDCSVYCDTPFGCRGNIVSTRSTLLAYDTALDYALLAPITTTNLNAAYGFLQMRESGPVLHEYIYIPQHPRGWGKRIAMSTTGLTGTSRATPCTITTMSKTDSCGVNLIGYDADTQGGSSGSPVIARRDNLVVGLHLCSGCPNGATSIPKVIQSLRKKGLLPFKSVA